jgi:hypothetical protein
LPERNAEIDPATTPPSTSATPFKRSSRVVEYHGLLRRLATSPFVTKKQSIRPAEQLSAKINSPATSHPPYLEKSLKVNRESCIALHLKGNDLPEMGNSKAGSFP